MTVERTNVALIASGSGTDGRAIMQAWKKGCIPNSNIKILISTKHGAECLEKADNVGVENDVIARSDYGSLDAFNHALNIRLSAENIQVVFLVGCLTKIYSIIGIDMYNIHPCDIHRHGGDGMYGLKNHRHVLQYIEDQIERGRKTLKDRFFTYPTVHEAVLEYDAGAILMQSAVEIPQRLVEEMMDGRASLEESASWLQQVVLPYEWMMLPCAVQMASQKILDKRKELQIS